MNLKSNFPNSTTQEVELLEKSMKQSLIKQLVPILGDHLCVQYWVQLIDKRTCIENIQKFTKKEILPDPNTYYTFSWDTLLYTDNDEYNSRIQEIETEFTRDQVEFLIKERLEVLIRNWIRETNYIWWYDVQELITALNTSSLGDQITIVDNTYIYINPSKVLSPNTSAEILHKIFAAEGIPYSKQRFLALMNPQEIRYIRIATWMNSKIARRIKDAKRNWYATYLQELKDWVDNYRIPLMHGIGLEEYQERYYPHGEFMANILGYVTWEWESYYGIEEYFEKILGWKDWKILGLATPRIGEIWANNFEISQPTDGSDITLTIDPVIQKELENTAWYFTRAFRADSVAITVIDPHTSEIKWLANSPTYNPNNYNASYKLRPIQYDERYLIDDITYIDTPIFVLSWEQLIQTTSETRTTEWQRKYIFENYLWPQVFVDKNISFPYEPWSIFKAITLWIGIDSNSIWLNEFYQDDGKVSIWPFTIANVSSKCLWFNTFSHALGYSCNVWMVRIAQRVTKYVFYEYLKLLWFGELTWIELAWEQWWSLPDFNTVSVARYFNNTYWQWILATPLQMAVAYWALINWWTYIQPTIIKDIYDSQTDEYQTISKKERITVFDTITSDSIVDSLVDVIDTWWLQKYKKEGYSLWWKTWTSEIAYKWKYQWWAWRTNGSFVGLVTAETSKYVIAIQVRRPRTSPWGSDTAWRIFSQVSEFLIAYDAIDE